MGHDWKANYPEPRPTLRVLHRARFGSVGVVPGTAMGRASVQLSRYYPRTVPRHRLPCWFPSIQRHGESRTGIVREPPSRARRAKPGPSPAWPTMAGRKYHRSDRGHGNGGYESTGTYYSPTRTGRRGNTATTTAPSRWWATAPWISMPPWRWI